MQQRSTSNLQLSKSQYYGHEPSRTSSGFYKHPEKIQNKYEAQMERYMKLKQHYPKQVDLRQTYYHPEQPRRHLATETNHIRRESNELQFKEAFASGRKYERPPRESLGFRDSRENHPMLRENQSFLRESKPLVKESYQLQGRDYAFKDSYTREINNCNSTKTNSDKIRVESNFSIETAKKPVVSNTLLYMKERDQIMASLLTQEEVAQYRERLLRKY